MAEEQWQAARLIPVAGSSRGAEAEQRATSALLAVLRVVRPFSRTLLSPLGATKAERANVECFIEVPFKDSAGNRVRPDGLVRVSFGRSAPWVALIEVKTGTDQLKAEQLNSYFEVASANRFDCVISISNEIAPAPGVHPCGGLKVRANSKVKVHHLSWSLILSEALSEKRHRGVPDPEQAWILQELIRYLEHPSSGALRFEDMGPNWNAVRDGARNGSLLRRDEGVNDIAMRWDQLLRYTALRLASDISDDVQEVIPRRHQQDPALRTRSFVETLCDGATLAGTLRIPNTAGDLDVMVDLKARQTVIAMEVAAPLDRRAKARVAWLTRQLDNAPESAVVEAFSKKSRAPELAYLPDAVADPLLLVGEPKKDPTKFRIVLRTEMGLGRKAGKKPGFVDSIVNAVEHFYSSVAQDVTAHRPKAPRIEKPAAAYLETSPESEPAKLAESRAEAVRAETREVPSSYPLVLSQPMGRL